LCFLIFLRWGQEYITGPSKKPFVMYGAGGSGKSAMLSKGKSANSRKVRVQQRKCKQTKAPCKEVFIFRDISKEFGVWKVIIRPKTVTQAKKLHIFYFSFNYFLYDLWDFYYHVYYLSYNKIRAN
jgi:hypothetical protein